MKQRRNFEVVLNVPAEDVQTLRLLTFRIFRVVLDVDLTVIDRDDAGQSEREQ
jgi:hypothetical protein